MRQRLPIVKKRRRQTKAQRELEAEAREQFKRMVLFLDLHQCIGRRLGSDLKCSGPLQAHHAIPQKVLRTHISTLALTEEEVIEWLWDPAIGVAICDGHHDAHTARVHGAKPFAFPLEWLPARNLDWAESRSVRHLLEREHPPLFSDGR